MLGQPVNGPIVTVGVMAYNEEAHIGATLSSIAAQPYSDFEVVVADNASTDRTGEIAQEYAASDARIRYVCQPRNVGAILNFHSLVRQARGRYFVLAGAHDLWSSNYLTDLVQALEENDSAVLAYGRTTWIDEQGAEMDRRVSFSDTSGLNALARFNITIWSNQHALYGMYRIDSLLECRTNVLMVGNGAVLLAELALRGSSVVVPEAIWYRRAVRKKETREEKLERYYEVLFPSRRMRLLPHLRIPVEHVRAVLQSDLKATIKIAALLCCPVVLVAQWQNILRDVFDIFSRTLRLLRRVAKR